MLTLDQVNGFICKFEELDQGLLSDWSKYEELREQGLLASVPHLLDCLEEAILSEVRSEVETENAKYISALHLRDLCSLLVEIRQSRV